MILEAGLVKAIAAGGGLVSSVVLVAGLTGGGQVATAQADPARLTKSICAYAPSTSGGSNLRIDGGKLGLSTNQLGHAKTIVDVATDLRLPRRAAEIALGTVLQESWLDNSVTGDHGTSFGLFQQRPITGWGTHKQVTTPSHAARSFYQRLVKVKGWETMPLTQAAAIVQRPRSDLRGAYAKHEPLAKKIVAALWRTTTPATGKSLGLSTAETDAVRLSIEAAASLGIPRQMVVDDIATNLTARPRADPTEIKKRAETIVTTLAQRLCTELTAKLGDIVEGIATGSSRGAIAVAAARKMINVPYSWGGGSKTGPSYGIGRGASTRGFDCSGLVEYAWGKVGVSVGGHTSTQWKSGVRVPRAQIQPGDLVFFATNPKDPDTIHHVGIAVSTRRMIHAPFTGSSVREETWAGVPRREAELAGVIRPRD